MSAQGQSQRIADFLRAHPNEEILAPELNRIGAGDDGFYCASLSKRISDCRAMGLNIVKTKDEIRGGKRRTAYTFKP